METLFPGWYSILCINPNNDTITLREDSLKILSGSLSTLECLDVVRLYLGGQPHDINFIKKFYSTFYDIDKTFPNRGNRFEIQFLAAGLIEKILFSHENVDCAIATAIAIICSDGIGRNKEIIPNLRPMADNFLHSNAIQLRKQTKIDLSQTTSFKSMVLKSIQDIETTITNSQQLELSRLKELQAIYKQESSNTTSIIRAMNNSIATNIKNINILSEENTLLKLLLSTVLFTYDKTKKYDNSILLDIAIELSNAHSWYTPHIQSINMISEILRAYEYDNVNISFVNIVNDITKDKAIDWIKEMDIEAIVDLCPFTACLVKQHKLQENDNIQFISGHLDLAKMIRDTTHIVYMLMLERMLGLLTKEIL